MVYKADIVTFNKVTTSPTWTNAPLKPTTTSVTSETASDVSTAISTVLANLGSMQAGESIQIIVVVSS